MADRDWTSILLFIVCSLERFCLGQQGKKKVERTIKERRKRCWHRLGVETSNERV